MQNYKNNLSEGMYLIDDNLHSFLDKGSSMLLEGKSMVKNLEGYYLVLLRVLNKDSNVIIYNYIFYPDIFRNALLYFLVQRKDYKNSTVYNE
jgi:hypothetical protein